MGNKNDLKAVIDMGTNTFHLLIARVDETGRLDKVVDKKVPVMLGRGGISDGRLTDEAMKRGVDALSNFADTLKTNGIDPADVPAFATSAVRSARNGGEFTDAIFQKAGLCVQVIDGRTEAELIFRGVAGSGALAGADRALVMDIGGGSVEFILNRNKEITWLESFEIGGQRLLDRFMKSDPITQEHITELESFLEIQLKPLFEACSSYCPTILAGASGSFDTIHEIARLSNHLEQGDWRGTVSPSYITSLQQEFCSKNRTQRLAIPGMVEMRVDMIVMSVTLLDFVVRKIGVKEVRCSPYALKEGALLQ